MSDAIEMVGGGDGININHECVFTKRYFCSGFFEKKRNDPVASRWNRILGSKIILITVVRHKMNCHKGDEGPYSGFATKSCWMRGLFLYKELMTKPRPSGEFGIPDDLFDDHI